MRQGSDNVEQQMALLSPPSSRLSSATHVRVLGLLIGPLPPLECEAQSSAGGGKEGGVLQHLQPRPRLNIIFDYYVPTLPHC